MLAAFSPGNLWAEMGKNKNYYLFGESAWMKNSLGGKLVSHFMSFVTELMSATVDAFTDSKWKKVNMSWFPAKASTKQMQHYLQLMKAGKQGKTVFNKFDYGDVWTNHLHYGHPTPPDIPIQGISKVPIAMFVGKVDPLGDPLDTRFLRDQIRNVVHYEELETFDHSFFQRTDMSYVKKVIKLADAHKNK